LEPGRGFRLLGCGLLGRSKAGALRGIELGVRRQEQ
jgi:hypothetical protein